MSNRGSEWRKWDLHLHTASSYDYKYKAGDSDEILIDKLTENNIEGVVITDHFVIDKNRIENLKRIAEEKKTKIKFFPGVELRTDKGDTNIHIILIFSNETDIDTLSKDFEYFKRNTSKANDSETTIYWDYNDIVKFAQERNGLISIHAGHKSNGIDERITNKLEHNQAIKIEYSKTVDIFEMGKVKDLEGYKNHVFPKIGRRPLIISSDNHDPRCYDNNKCLWIKSDLTFEGLKQIIYEPDERIKYGKSNPNDKLDYLLIDYLEYDDNKKIFFNSGLNTIIGGRSTGKSTLLNSIAKYQNNPNSKEDHYTLPNVKVIWRDGQLDAAREVEFIPQEFMINISKNTKDLNNLLHKIIKEKDMTKEEDKYKENVNEVRENINRYLNEYFSKIDLINEISKPEGDREGITKSIEELNKKINLIRLNSQFDEKENNLYQEKCLELANLQEDLQKNESESKNLLILRDKPLTVNINLENISDENKQLLNTKLSAIVSQLNNEWEHSINEVINEVNHNITNLKNNINTVEASEIYIKGNELKDKNTELSELETKLSLEKQKLNVIENYEQKIMNLKEQIKHYSINIVKEFIKYKDEISLLEKTFNINENELSIKINPVLTDFSKKIDYLNARNKNSNDFVEKFKNIMINNNNEGMKKELLEIFNNNDLVFNRNKTLKDFINDIFSSNWFTYDYIITYQKDEFKNMSQGKKSFVILKLLLEFSDNKKPVLIDQPEDSLDNRAIYHELRNYILKTKKQRQVIIVTHNANVVVGADAENIIIANQHNEKEKNRDSVKFQYVNGSLENTKPKDEKCEYILESQGIREHIFDILKGGTEAFVKREQKYNVNNSLKNKYKM